MILKEIIDQVQWSDVAIAIVTEHPWCRKRLEGYKKVLETLRLMESAESEFSIIIDYTPDILKPEYKYPDVYGVKEGVNERWSLSFSPWKEWLGMVVCQETLEGFTVSQIVANCLFDMTFFMGRLFEGRLVLPFAAAGAAASAIVITICHDASSPA